MIKHLLTLLVLTFALTACSGRITINHEHKTSSTTKAPYFEVDWVKKSGLCQISGDTNSRAHVDLIVNGYLETYTKADGLGRFKFHFTLDRGLNTVRVTAYHKGIAAEYSRTIRNIPLR